MSILQKLFSKPEAETMSAGLTRNDYFISRVSRKYVFSSILSMVFIYAGSLIDTLIVGAFLNEDGLSAMSLVSPVYLVYYTVGATIGIGASIEASRVLGRGDMNSYQRLFTVTTASMTAAAVLMTLTGYIFLNPISGALSGHDARYQELVRQYLLFYLPGGALNLLSYIPNYFLKTEGKPKISSVLFFLSAAVNVVLSWLFMCPVCDMGIGGASLATSISMLITAGAGFAILLSNKTGLKFVWKKPDFALLKTSVISGIPNGLSNLLESARILMINMLLIRIGQSLLLPCYTVVRNVSDILSAIAIGISSALLPLIGVFFGERDYVSERSVLRYALRLGLIIMTPLTILVCILPDPLFSLFSVSDPIVLAAGRWAIPLACIGQIAGYVNMLFTGYLTSIKREKLATTLVALRLFIVLAVCAFPLSMVLAEKGIWLSLSLAELLSMLVCFVVRAWLCRKTPTLDRFLLDTSKESKREISFSVKNDVQDIVNASMRISEFCEEQELDIKRSMRVSLAIEEILTFLIEHCLGTDKKKFIDLRISMLNEEVMMRFRYVGELFDPITFYADNQDNEEMESDLLGVKLILKAAQLVDFRQTLGTNNLMIFF